jgi:hypothetical protein
MAASHSEGKGLHAAMMMCQKHKPTSDENQVENDGYELGDTSTDVTGECESFGGGKRQRTDSLRRRTTSTRLDEILTSSEEQRQEIRQNHQENLAAQTQSREIQRELCDIQRRAVDIQERTSMALLELLRQTLSPPSV